MNFTLLADQPAAADTVAQWYFDEWASSVPDVTVENIRRKVARSISRHSAPMIVLAVEQDIIIGAAELKLREMTIYPEYEHWVGGVYVEKSRRGEGVGSGLVKEVIGRAKKANIEKLYLQTQALDGGIYARLGFQPLENVNYNGRDVLVMSAAISP